LRGMAISGTQRTLRKWRHIGHTLFELQWLLSLFA
jgi:hypothetical protein